MVGQPLLAGLVQVGVVRFTFSAEVAMRLATTDEVRAPLEAAELRFRAFVALVAFARLRLGEAAMPLVLIAAGFDVVTVQWALGHAKATDAPGCGSSASRDVGFCGLCADWGGVRWCLTWGQRRSFTG